MSEAHVRELTAAKQNILKQKGEATPAWVLDQVNIETMFANRVAMGRGLTAPRFRWVSFDDALLFPLSNEAQKRFNQDYKGFYPAEEKLLKRYLSDLNIRTLPRTLDTYLKQVVTPTLERQKRNGAVAIKYEAAYLRKLDFDNPDEAKARLTYPRELSEILRNWLEFYPDKVLFGTDAFSFGPEVDWGEVAWLSNTTARQALALALTGMMNDGEIDRAHAMELARLVLHDNAAKLYKF